MESKDKIIVGFKSSRKMDPTEIDEDESEDEDHDDDDYLDFSTSGLKTKLPGKRIVEMIILNTNRVVHVKCRLPWTWSWLQATIELRYPIDANRSSEAQQLIDGKFKVLQYHLDPSDGYSGISAISLFLKDIAIVGGNRDVDVSHLNQYQSFCSWLSNLPSHVVTLSKLEQLLSQYESEDTGQRMVQVNLFRQLIASSVAGQVFTLATHQPTFFRAAPILFPKKIVSILESPELLEIFEEIAMEAPWKFGFSEVMYKETHYSSLEAPLFALRNAWFFPQLSELHRTALVTYDVFKSTCRSKGHTFLLHRDMPTHFNYYQKDQRWGGKEQEDIPGEGQMYSAIEFLIEKEIVRREVKNAEERFHLSRYWKAEEGICLGLEAVLLAPNLLLDVDLDDTDQFGKIHGDVAQMAAARSIIEKAVTMVSGRGGTGKTEVVSSVLKAAEQGLWGGKTSWNEKNLGEKDSSMKEKSNGPILYCAPTGKAVSVIKKRVGSKAFTIHQILASYKLWRSGTQEQKWKFGDTRIVAVDECSMVSIEIFNLLIKYLLDGAHLVKIVLLGDHLQLPSVDPGNFMEDLYSSLKPRGYTVNLVTNHRSSGSIIFENATRISNQQIPVFDSNQGFSLILPEGCSIRSLPTNIRSGASLLPPCPTPLPQTMKARGREPDMGKLILYWTLLRQHRERYNIEDDETSQIISFLNNECNALNQFGCFVYNKHLTWSSREGSGKRVKKQFYIGDKIICTKNSDIPIYVSLEGDEDVQTQSDDLKFNIESTESDGKYTEPSILNLQSKTERLMNGNLYKIRAYCKANVMNKNKEESDKNSQDGDKTSITYYVLDDLAGDIIRARPDLLIKKTKITHAWALSIHKFQGSESDSIVYCLSGSGYESWKHVYTAVTRGKKNVVIVGSYEDLERAVKKKPIMRQTSLAEKVRKMVCGLASKRAESEKENIDSGNGKEEVKFEHSLRGLGSEKDCNRTNTSYSAIRTQPIFVADDSFGDLECSQLEKEAIQACQVADIRRAQSEKENNDLEYDKVEVQKSVDDETMISPRKQSQMFQDWRSQGEMLSPGKRKSYTVCKPRSDSKVHRASSQLNEFGLKSPAKKCKTATFNTYPTVRKQVQFVADNSFDDLEGSLLEEETRQAYQVEDTRRVEESKKKEVEKSVNNETPTTPGKLSRMFEDSMRDSFGTSHSTTSTQISLVVDEDFFDDSDSS